MNPPLWELKALRDLIFYLLYLWSTFSSELLSNIKCTLRFSNWTLRLVPTSPRLEMTFQRSSLDQSESFLNGSVAKNVLWSTLCNSICLKACVFLSIRISLLQAKTSRYPLSFSMKDVFQRWEISLNTPCISHVGYCFWVGSLLLSSSILFLFAVLVNDDNSLFLMSVLVLKYVNTSLFNPHIIHMQWILSTF